MQREKKETLKIKLKEKGKKKRRKKKNTNLPICSKWVVYLYDFYLVISLLPMCIYLKYRLAGTLLKLRHVMTGQALLVDKVPGLSSEAGVVSSWISLFGNPAKNTELTTVIGTANPRSVFESSVVSSISIISHFSAE